MDCKSKCEQLDEKAFNENRKISYVLGVGEDLSKRTQTPTERDNVDKLGYLKRRISPH